jgi:hypothetical protein
MKELKGRKEEGKEGREGGREERKKREGGRGKGKKRNIPTIPIFQNAFIISHYNYLQLGTNY